MFSKKFATIGLVGFSASTILLLSNVAFGQTVNQQVNGSAIGPDTFVDGTNFTVNPSGTLNQQVNCEARNNVPHIDPRCEGHNTAIYGGTPPTGTGHDDDHHHHEHPGDPSLNQTVTNGGSNTTVIAPATANSSANSSSNSSSKSNANATIRDSGNSSNTNSIGDQKNQQSVTTGANTVSPNISPSTRVKVDGDQYNNIQFGSQAPGTGGEAFSLQYRSGCGTSVNYRQGFALKPKQIGGGALGFALNVSSTDMDTIENRSGVQGKMNTAFQVAMNVVDSQQSFEQRLNTGAVSRQEAETRAIANCAPQYPIVRNVNHERTVEISREYVEKPPRVCTARGCN
jgi:hypothetical protein